MFIITFGEHVILNLHKHSAVPRTAVVQLHLYKIYIFIKDIKYEKILLKYLCDVRTLLGLIYSYNIT